MMVALCDVPSVVADFIVSDLDLERVERKVVPERMITYAQNTNFDEPPCNCPSSCS